jgi:general secretion pathway protein G
MKKLFVSCLLLATAGCGLMCWMAWLMDPPFTPDLQTQTEIAELQAAVDAFREDFHVSYIPSHIKLSETGNYLQRDQPNTLDFDSVQYLHKLWPKLDVAPGCRIDWNGDGRIEGDWTLEGDECLVFFLGGIPSKCGDKACCLGFDHDPKDPTARGRRRDGPYFAFFSWRLRDLHGRGFFSYLDPHRRGQPYAYFSSYGEPNGYNCYGDTDCPSLRVWPYAEVFDKTPQFLNADSCQIISAGRDGQFGPGTDSPSHAWSPTRASSVPTEGRDDRSNFYRRQLGVPN